MQHDGCKGCKYEREDATSVHCSGCKQTAMDKYTRRTNADTIRAMTDEELAINMMCPKIYGLADIECDRSDSCNCYECILKWLRTEVEE